jgi:hypothetical protein
MTSETADLQWSISDAEHSVRVGRVLTRNGVRLRIERVDGTGAVELDAIELESFTAEGLELGRLLGLES